MKTILSVLCDNWYLSKHIYWYRRFWNVTYKLLKADQWSQTGDWYSQPTTHADRLETKVLIQYKDVILPV